MRYWLDRNLMGFHIGGFNILIEEDEDQNTSELIRTNVSASIDFLKDLHEISKEYSDRDGLDRYRSLGVSFINMLTRSFYAQLLRTQIQKLKKTVKS